MKYLVYLIIICCMLVSSAICGSQDTIDVFILAGQSNMDGRGKFGDIDISLQFIPENVSFYTQRFGRFFYTRGFGPEITFSHQLSEKFPEKRLMFIKLAFGGTSLLAWDPGWKKERAEITKNEKWGNLYKKLMDFVALSIKGKKVKMVGVLWMQGERDAKFPEAAKEYFDNLNKLIVTMRKDLKAPGMYFIYGQVNPPAEKYPGLEKVRADQARAEKEIPNTKMVSTEGLGKWNDNLHYNTEGQLELGKRFAKAYLELIEKK
jgi:hypothetical protein